MIGPLLISRAIDQLNVGKHGAAPVFTAFAGLAIGWVLLRFVAGVTPYLREAIFTPVSQMALARSAMETFGHALSLSLNFHQGKQTGGLAAADRSRRAVDRLSAAQRGVQPGADSARADDGGLCADQPLQLAPGPWSPS